MARFCLFRKPSGCRFLWFVLPGAPAARVRGMKQPMPGGGTERADPCGPAGNASRGPDRSRAGRHADGHDGVAVAMNVPISAEIDPAPIPGSPAGDFAFRMNDLAR